MVAGGVAFERRAEESGPLRGAPRSRNDLTERLEKKRNIDSEVMPSRNPESKLENAFALVEIPPVRADVPKPEAGRRHGVRVVHLLRHGERSTSLRDGLIELPELRES